MVLDNYLKELFTILIHHRSSFVVKHGWIFLALTKTI